VLRIIGDALVLVACSGLGFQFAGGYEKRTREIQSLMQSVRLLRTEIEFKHNPLPQALEHVAMRSDNGIANVFQEAARELQRGTVSVAEAFQFATQKYAGKLALQAGELNLLGEFGKTLGTSDMMSQVRQVDVILAGLDSCHQDALTAAGKNVRMWRYMGVLVGLTVVVLMS